ncbi:MAG: hypothetical protein CL764_03725 [Chloroflexi bacterium]|nr:hypothetical protein [Chloroflexota bacterium]|tara:strand:+ start:2177 stop:3016 length:840 start_codon:yes stop_codon:yes gene_type:complete
MNYTESQKKFEQSFVSDINQENQKFINVPLMILKLESMYHEVDVIETLGKISNITKEIKETTTAFDTFYDIIQSTNNYLFDVIKIQGNSLDYHHPNNSFLNKVLQTKTGNPVSISIIYQEICRQLGFDLMGIGIPEHYLLKHGNGESLIFLDPYNKGVLLTKKEVLQITNKKNKHSTNIKVSEDSIKEYGPRKTVLRVLNNLKFSFSSINEFDKALWISNIILKIQPNNIQNLMHLISLHKELNNDSRALEILDNYIEKSPEDSPITINLINIRKKLFN